MTHPLNARRWRARPEPSVASKSGSGWRGQFPLIAAIGTGLAGGIVVVALVIAGAARDADYLAGPEPVRGAAIVPAAEPLEPVREAAAGGIAAVETDGEADTPQAEDPRWADAFAESASDPVADPEARRAAEALLAAYADISPPALDERTSGIGDPFEPIGDGVVVIAETEEQVAMLEDIQRAENEVLIAALREEGTAFSNDGPAEGMREAVIRSHVNLRDAPSNNSTVLAILPANARVEASRECALRWCEVVHEGRRGYVFEGFIR